MKTMIDKDSLDALFKDLDDIYAGTDDYDQLLRDAHLGIALSDAGRDLAGQVDGRIAALIKKHRHGE